MAPSHLGIFYKALEDYELKTSVWFLAQPFRLVAYNGEINTLLCNRNWMLAREAMLEHPIWGNEPEWLKPVIRPGGSLCWRTLKRPAAPPPGISWRTGH